MNGLVPLAYAIGCVLKVLSYIVCTVLSTWRVNLRKSYLNWWETLLLVSCTLNGIEGEKMV